MSRCLKVFFIAVLLSIFSLNFTEVYAQQISSQPNNGLISDREAEEKAADFANLSSDYYPNPATFTYDSRSKPWYTVYFYRYDSQTKKSYWGKTVVVNAKDGTILTDQEKLRELGAAEGDTPPGIDPITKAYIPTLSEKIGEFLPWIFLVIIIILGIGLFKFRRKLGRLRSKFRSLDIIFGSATLVQLLLALYFFITASDANNFVFLLTSTFGTVTTWITTRIYYKTPSENLENIGVIPPDKLPKFIDVGGMEQVKQELRQTVGIMTSKSKEAQNLGVNFNGVLLFGPPGVGKSYLVKATAGEMGLNFISVKVSDLIGMYTGESSKNISAIFKVALKNAPCLLFFDEFDAIAVSRGSDGGITTEDSRVVNELLRNLEEIRSASGKVIVFAATNNKDQLDEAVIRSGRFDRQIFIPLPDTAARKAIFETRLKNKPIAQDVNLDELVLKTEGMSAADLSTIIDKAALKLISASGAGQQITLNQASLVDAIVNFREKQKPNVTKLTWDDLILQDEVITELKRLVKVIENSDTTLKLGIEPPKGVLLYGPPGTGKTTIAKVIANEAKASFFSISQADIFSKWLGESEKNIKKIFDEARRFKPAIIFIDEIDAVVAKRGGEAGAWTDKTVNQILQEIDGLKDSSYVFVIGATNVPDMIDPALLRGGRLSTQIEIPSPGKIERQKLFSLFLKNIPVVDDLNLEELVKNSDGYSGADIKEICQRAILAKFDQNGPGATLIQADLIASIQKYKKYSKAYDIPSYFGKTGGLSSQEIKER